MSSDRVEKACPQCGVTKVVAEFFSQPKRPGGISSWCRVCTRAAVAKRRAKNPGTDKAYAQAHKEEARQRWKLYYEANKERLASAKVAYRQTGRGEDVVVRTSARQRAQSVGAQGDFSWIQVLQQQGGRCLFCGTTEDLTVDHIVPLSRGGSNGAENVRALCKTVTPGRERDSTASFQPRSGAS